MTKKLLIQYPKNCPFRINEKCSVSFGNKPECFDEHIFPIDCPLMDYDEPNVLQIRLLGLFR